MGPMMVELTAPLNSPLHIVVFLLCKFGSSLLLCVFFLENQFVTIITSVLLSSTFVNEVLCSTCFVLFPPVCG